MILVDGSSLLHRVLNTEQADLTDPQGRSLGGVHGFLTSLGATCDREKRNKMVIVAWDLGVPLFRRTIFRNYKPQKFPVGDMQENYLSDQNLLNRTHEDGGEAEPDSFLDKYQMCRRILHSEILPKLGVFSIHVNNCEADDIIAYACSKLTSDYILILSADRDMFQLLTDKRTFYDGRSNQDNKVWRIPDVVEKYGLWPEKWLDHWVISRAIAGDVSDGIPGIPEIGFDKAVMYAKQVLELMADGTVTMTQALAKTQRVFKGRVAGHEALKAGAGIVKRNIKLMDLQYPIMMDLPIVREIRSNVRSCYIHKANPEEADLKLHSYGMNRARQSAQVIYESCSRHNPEKIIAKLI